MATAMQLERRANALGFWTGNRSAWEGVQDPETGGYFALHVGRLGKSRDGTEQRWAAHLGFRTYQELETWIEHQEIQADCDAREIVGVCLDPLRPKIEDLT